MQTKQVIVMRRDLKMRRGKEIAQGSHASMSFLSRRVESGESLTTAQKEWLNSSFKKVCVRVNSEEELCAAAQRAAEAGVECHVITDSGATEFHDVPTKTCLAIGPDYDDRVDAVTGDLELY